MSACVPPPAPPSEIEIARAELWAQLKIYTASEFGARAKRLRLSGMAHLVKAEREWANWQAGGADGTGEEEEELRERPARAHGLLSKQVEKPARPRGVKAEIDGRKVKVSEWHAARAMGLVKKFDRMSECSEARDYLKMECRFCGAQHLQIVGCGHRECPRCRFGAAKKVRKQVDAARRALREEAKRLFRDRTIREKLLTLTVPHVGAGRVRVKGEWVERDAVTRRIEILHSAWEGFGEWLRKYSLDRLPKTSKGNPLPSLVALVHFFRVFEWTEGKSDHDGHPHFHVYLHGPRLDYAAIREAWARHVAIVSGEAQRDDIVIDIRQATDGGNVRDSKGKKTGLSAELVKYMVKDFSDVNRGIFVSAGTLSKVWLAMLGRRRRQTSAGFAELTARCIERAEDQECRDCGVTGAIEYRFQPRSLDFRPCETGPPCTEAARHVVTLPAVGSLPAQFAFQI